MFSLTRIAVNFYPFCKIINDVKIDRAISSLFLVLISARVCNCGPTTRENRVKSDRKKSQFTWMVIVAARLRSLRTDDSLSKGHSRSMNQKLEL